MSQLVVEAYFCSILLAARTHYLNRTPTVSDNLRMDFSFKCTKQQGGARPQSYTNLSLSMFFGMKD